MFTTTKESPFGFERLFTFCNFCSPYSLNTIYMVHRIPKGSLRTTISLKFPFKKEKFFSFNTLSLPFDYSRSYRSVLVRVFEFNNFLSLYIFRKNCKTNIYSQLGTKSRSLDSIISTLQGKG